MNKEGTGILTALVGFSCYGIFLNFTDSKIQNGRPWKHSATSSGMRYHTLAQAVPAMFIARRHCYLLSKEAVPVTRAQSQ